MKNNSVMPWTIKNPSRTVALEIKIELLFWLNDIACMLEAEGEDGTGTMRNG